jgi:hypothetical protein
VGAPQHAAQSALIGADAVKLIVDINAGEAALKRKCPAVTWIFFEPANQV